MYGYIYIYIYDETTCPTKGKHSGTFSLLSLGSMAVDQPNVCALMAKWNDDLWIQRFNTGNNLQK